MNTSGLLAVLAVLAIVATILFGQSGVIRVWLLGRHQHDEATHMKEQEEVQASDLIIKQALALVETLSRQVKDLRDANLTSEQQQTKETQLLREHIHTLELRVGELERKLAEKDIDLSKKDLEIAKLKSLLYDSDHQQRTTPGT
jgi:hypothetical protein